MKILSLDIDFRFLKKKFEFDDFKSNLQLAKFLLKNDLFSTKKNIKFADIFSKSKNINFLSVARVFLFGARDVWFVVGLPVFFYNIFSDGTTEGKQSAFYIVGSIMALWVILYGLVQASSPRLFQNKENKDPDLIQISKKCFYYERYSS